MTDCVACRPRFFYFLFVQSVSTFERYAQYSLQDAQLSQRDRAAGCVTVFAKSRRLELGDNILRTL